MPACSTASLGALSLSGRGLGQGSKYDASFCAWYDAQPFTTQNTFPAAAGTACDQLAAGGAVPSGAPSGNGGNGGAGLAEVLTALFGAVPGTITAIRGPAGGRPPPQYQPPAQRAGMGMLGLVAIGVVVWMFAAQGRRD